MVESERFEYVDGIRGVAAVAVVVFHLLSCFAPDVVPEYAAQRTNVLFLSISVLWNGYLAVMIFFVTSGMILTFAARRRSDPLWINLVIRYLRLAVPAGLSVLCAWLLLTLFPTSASELRAITGSDWLRWTYQAPVPALPTALHDGFVAIFVSGGSFFNNALWSMRPELIGSVVCFSIALFQGRPVRILITVAFAIASIVLWRPNYLCFALGILLAEGQSSKWLRPVLPGWCVAVGLFVGSVTTIDYKRGDTDWLLTIQDHLGSMAFIPPFAALLIVYGCMYAPQLRRTLSARIPRFLGKISFPLYLLHVPLIYTVLAEAAVRTLHYPILFLAILAVWLTALVAISYYAAQYLERPFLRWLEKRRVALGLWRPFAVK